MYQLSSILVLAAVASLSLAVLPQGWKACKSNSTDYQKCLSQQIENAIYSLKDGNKKFGINPLDPMNVEILNIEQSTGPVSINLQYKDLNFKGLSNIKIIEIRNDWKELSFKGIIKEVQIKGYYKINGKVLMLPIVGDGPCTMIWQNITNIVNLNLKEMEKMGTIYFDVSHFYNDITPGKISMNYENLFSKDKGLGNSINLFLNENWEVILKDLKPIISQAWTRAFEKVAKKVFSNIPKSELVG